ncbi:hypothetical protein [Paenibacillus whitsoniae]|uniref:Uncharacterized protein n=1 Tax=Paenibacillus whitsoniae TaxID=2496558 RepID=A0A3S0CDJ9_9BACL|nr:hypothetical protein [Paenibacillus whitsoniae]RTE11511.1 hypothetical protein EJQ19_01575 [Paenibacillus whitsoniae]
MPASLNEQELLQFIINQTKLDPKQIQLVLKHEKTFMDKAEQKGSREIDIDDVIDYIVGRPDVKLSELAVDTILETEMSFLMKNGLAGYMD